MEATHDAPPPAGVASAEGDQGSLSTDDVWQRPMLPEAAPREIVRDVVEQAGRVAPARADAPEDTNSPEPSEPGPEAATPAATDADDAPPATSRPTPSPADAATRTAPPRSPRPGHAGIALSSDAHNASADDSRPARSTDVPDARLGEALPDATTPDAAALDAPTPDPATPPAEAPDPTASQPPAADVRAAEVRAADVRPTPVPLPARLAVPSWLGKLSATAGQAVQVMLGEDGTVRLQTQREQDGVTVSVRFSDPDLQALAGAHAVRLREVLEAHFTEPVRLSLSDGLAADAGASDSHTSDGRASNGASPGASADGAAVSTTSTARSTARASGRREWIG